MISVYKKKDKGKVSKNFDVTEFHCRCKECHLTFVDDALVGVAQIIRNLIKAPLIINSAYRCQKHNKEEGGQPESYHCRGMAIDISLNKNRENIIKIVDDLKKTKIISYYYVKDNFLHLQIEGNNGLYH